LIDFIIATLRIGNSLLLAYNNRLSWPMSLAISFVKISALYHGGMTVLASGKIINLIICLCAWHRWSRQDARKRSTPGQLLKSSHSMLLISILLLLGIIFVVQQKWTHLEGIIAILSISAYLLTAMRKNECWALWILYDILLIILYFEKTWYLSAIATMVYLPIGLFGYHRWQKASHQTP
jgi:nicotinamide mononucleotide transporter PnuC